MVPANEALNFIMVTIIKNGFQVDVPENGIYRKWFRIQAPDGPNGPKRGPGGAHAALGSLGFLAPMALGSQFSRICATGFAPNAVFAMLRAWPWPGPGQTRQHIFRNDG